MLLVNNLSTQVQIPAHTGKKTRGTPNVSPDRINLISLMSIVKLSRTSEQVKVGDLLAQWLSAVG